MRIQSKNKLVQCSVNSSVKSFAKSVGGVLAATLLLNATPVVADEWVGQGEAGFVVSSGNTESENVNLGLGFTKKTDVWSQDIKITLFKGSNNKIDSADNRGVNYTAQKPIFEDTHFFVKLNYLDDSFDSFTAQKSAYLGLARQIIETETSNFEIGAGLGYRDTSEELTGKKLSGVSSTLFANYTNQLTPNTNFINKLKAELSSDNNFIENDLAVLVAMNETLSLKAGLLIRHNTDPSVGFDKTDTITSMNLVYNFN